LGGGLGGAAVDFLLTSYRAGEHGDRDDTLAQIHFCTLFGLQMTTGGHGFHFVPTESVITLRNDVI